MKRKFVWISGLVALMVMAMPVLAFAAEEEPQAALFATPWSVLPPLIAIGLALITKEVYSSLFIGVVTGGILYAGADFDGILNHVFMDGIVTSLSNSGNVGILVFLVFLGVLVAMMNKSGGSAARSEDGRHRRSKREKARSALLSCSVC